MKSENLWKECATVILGYGHHILSAKKRAVGKIVGVPDQQDQYLIRLISEQLHKAESFESIGLREVAKKIQLSYPN